MRSRDALGNLSLTGLRNAWWGHPVRESGWQLDLGRLLADPVWRGVDVAYGDGAPVLLVPGFLSGDPSFAYMRTWLRRIGYRTYRAGIRWNVDCADRSVRRLDQRLADVAARNGRRVHVVAHSRGGLFARALAYRNPDHLAQVITLGSPLGGEFDCSVPVAAAVAGARAAQTLIRPEAREKGCFTNNCSCGYSADLSGPLATGVPMTSIYTLDDGIVRPSSCVVADARCIAVRGTHLGLVMNAEVYRHVGRLLSARAGEEGA
jgi:triacylglycerol lipase